ncbi:PQQ-binding-like beta-propeller repeat protein [Thalassoglobus sp. JC818]|uniref:outer membrane protein assembly factor BamB family protein n=1 Tax=Thalassoglobus sp. JC818 TaxID=3232136 RepID=UPI00345915F4
MLIDRCRDCVFFVCLISLVSVQNVHGENTMPWPDRSGPHFNGSADEKDAANLPIKWNEKENVAWKISLEEQGHSTPVIGEGRIWLTAANEDGTKQFVYAIDEESGEILIHKLLFENPDPEPLGNNINTYASPSCVLEEGAVYVHFGSYGTAKLNSSTGDVIWTRRDIEGRHFRGPGSSPVLFRNSLILTFDCIDRQFLVSLDKETGETLWLTERTTDYDDLDENGQPKREGDLRKAYSTPGLIEVGDRVHLVSAGSRAAFGYDAATGEELWTITHDDYNAAARPSFFRGNAILNTGSRNANLLCVRLDETTQGNVDESHVLWDRPRGNSRLATPLLHDGLIYMVTDNGVAICIDAETGEEVWTDRVGGTFVASPIIANGNIYFCNEEGETIVIKAGREFEILSKNTLDEGMRASPAIANGAIFLRTFGHLYKIKRPNESSSK